VWRALGGPQQVRWRQSQQLDYTRQLIGLVLTSKQRTAGPQLGHDTAHTPHVNGRAVASA